MDNALLVTLALCVGPTSEFGQAPVLGEAWQRALDEELVDIDVDECGELLYLTAKGHDLLAETLGLDELAA